MKLLNLNQGSLSHLAEVLKSAQDYSLIESSVLILAS